jgi:hypothetical protein
MDSDFELVVGSDEDYENLIAEISYKGEFLALMSDENNDGFFDIEIHSRGDCEPWRFKLMDFQEAVAQAKQRLLKLRKLE